jgi:hypothetical protein
MTDLLGRSVCVQQLSERCCGIERRVASVVRPPCAQTPFLLDYHERDFSVVWTLYEKL